MTLRTVVIISLMANLFILLSAVTGSAKSNQQISRPPGGKPILFKSNTAPVPDSSAISVFFKGFPASDSIKSEVFGFYKLRAYRFAWLSKDGLTEAASGFYQQLQSDNLDFAEQGFSNARLETLVTEWKLNKKTFYAQKEKVIELELMLTASFFKYARKIYGGMTRESRELEWYIPRNKKNYRALLDSLVLLPSGGKLQEPVNEYYTRLKEKLKTYKSIQKSGGLPKVVNIKKEWKIGDTASILKQVGMHLLLTGDLLGNSTSIVFTDSLMMAVKNYQQRMGLIDNGQLNAATAVEMNKPIELRIRQIMVNMERLRWVPVEMEKDYLLVNIPEFKLHVFEDNKQVWATNVVVGKSVRRTSIFKDAVSQIILNPYWNVPASITRNEILPNLQRNPAYLKNNQMEVVSQHPFTVRQKPGINNALGKMKFLFPNNYNIYLHDTPAKNLFNETKRAFSHGCIRVQNPLRLVQYLLRKDTSWTSKRISSILQTDREFAIRISPTVPVYIAYFTAWVDYGGQINFRNDLYGLDKKLLSEIFKD